MKQHLWIGLLSVATLVTGCASKSAPPPAIDFHPVAVNNFAKTWTVNLGLAKGAKANNVYVFDNLIIVYANDSTAHVVNRQSGELKYIHSLPTHSGDLHAPSVIQDRIVYPATSTIKVYSVKTGALQNEIDVPYAIRTGGTGNGQSYYVSADFPNGGRLVAIDLTTRTSISRWEVMTVASMRAAPVLYGGIIYAAAEDGKVYAITEARGGVWALDETYEGAFRTGGAILGDVRVDETAIYVASLDSKLVALNRSTGAIIWQYISGVPLEHGAVSTNDTVYIYIKGQGLTAISKLTGDYIRKPRWSKPNAEKFLADDDKYAYVLLSSGQVAAIDKATGDQKFLSTRNDLTNFGVNTKDGLVYATDNAGNLLQVKPVVKQGVVGELVMEVQPLEIASR